MGEQETAPSPARAWVQPVFVGGDQAWLHECGAIGLFLSGATPTWSTLCATCERDRGGWRPLLVEVPVACCANTTIEQDERDLQQALREAPGSSHSQRAYRWRNTVTGAVLDALPARTDPAGRWVRQVAATATIHGRWHEIPT